MAARKTYTTEEVVDYFQDWWMDDSWGFTKEELVERIADGWTADKLKESLVQNCVYWGDNECGFMLFSPDVDWREVAREVGQWATDIYEDDRMTDETEEWKGWPKSISVLFAEVGKDWKAITDAADEDEDADDEVSEDPSEPEEDAAIRERLLAAKPLCAPVINALRENALFTEEEKRAMLALW